MSDLADFTLGFCRALGGVVDPPAYGVYDVLLPDAFAAQLRIPPFQRFAFDEGVEGDGVTQLAYGHPLVERMAELARAAPACAHFHLHDVRLDKSGLAELARAALSFANANLVEVPWAIETRLLFQYVRFNFKAALISDEKREHLVTVLMNAQTGAVVEDFSATEASRLAETPAFTGLPVAPAQWTQAPDPFAPEPLRALLERASRAATVSLAGPIGVLRSRADRLLELDRARLEAYYADLEADLQRRFERAEDDARRASLESKLATVRADHAAKLADAEAKYRLRAELDLVNLAIVGQPKLVLSMSVENRQAQVQRAIVYDPLRHTIEPLACDVCARPTTKLLLCANGHLAGADCLAPQCTDCKRVYCQTCATDITTCVVCDRPVCCRSRNTCRTCGRGTCRDHLNLCHAADGQPARITAAPVGEAESVPAQPPSSPPEPALSPHPKRAPTAAPRKPAPRPKAPASQPSRDPGYRLEVQIEKDTPLLVAFVLAKRGREIAQRHWELTEEGVLVSCLCEKGLECLADGSVLRPEPAAQIDAQLRGELAKLRAEYRIPARRVAIVAQQYGNLVRMPDLRLRGRWKDEAVLSAARSAFDSAGSSAFAVEPDFDFPEWVRSLGPKEAERLMPDIGRFARIAYGWLWYEGALKAGELAAQAASVARPGEWYSPERARDLFKADPSFRQARGNVIYIDLVAHPLKVLKEKEARGLPPRAFTADELLAATVGPLPLSTREAEIERELNRSTSQPLYVRSIQRIIRNTSDPTRLVAALVGVCAPRNLGEADQFAQLFAELWNITPRYELRGRTPAEVRRSRSPPGRLRT